MPVPASGFGLSVFGNKTLDVLTSSNSDFPISNG
jgi:hypothetical protein